jgi:hypothetical protein
MLNYIPSYFKWKMECYVFLEKKWVPKNKIEPSFTFLLLTELPGIVIWNVEICANT